MGPVRRRPDGKVAAGLGVQQEHEPEDEGQRRFFNPPELLPVAEVSAVRFDVLAKAARNLGYGRL